MQCIEIHVCNAFNLFHTQPHEMSQEMLIVVALLVGSLSLFALEKFPVELVALGVLATLLLTGVLVPKEAFAVLSNEAPLTVAALFILSDLLLRSGGIAGLSGFMTALTAKSQSLALLVLISIAAAASAFVNNTPVVAIFIPVVIQMTRENGIGPSRFLIPLSYAALLGGCCTLIGTSTNLVVHGIAVANRLPGFQMFEIALIGLPLLFICGALVMVLAPKFLPERQTVASLLTVEQRKARIFQLLVDRDSPLIGKHLADCDFLRSSGVILLEVRRKAERIRSGFDSVVIEPFDRLTIVARDTKEVEGDPEHPEIYFNGTAAAAFGLEVLSTIPGGVTEGVIGPMSSFAGRSLRELRLRSTHALHVLAVHRKSQNLLDRFLDVDLHVGDTLLIIGADTSIQQLSERGDLVLADEPSTQLTTPQTRDRARAWIIWATLIVVVLLPTLHVLPISTSAFIACVFLGFLGILKTNEAMRAVDWPVMLTIYGMLALGVAVEKTGLDQLVAGHLITWASGSFGTNLAPWVLLALFTFSTIFLTEIISNNAAAAVMAPLAIGVAEHLAVSAQPFLIAVTIGASLAFAVPMGYQTHLMVYGVGGYRFSDFLRIGLLLDLIVWGVTTLLVPLIWPFR